MKVYLILGQVPGGGRHRFFACRPPSHPPFEDGSATAERKNFFRHALFKVHQWQPSWHLHQHHLSPSTSTTNTPVNELTDEDSEGSSEISSSSGSTRLRNQIKANLPPKYLIKIMLTPKVFTKEAPNEFSSEEDADEESEDDAIRSTSSSDYFFYNQEETSSLDECSEDDEFGRQSNDNISFEDSVIRGECFYNATCFHDWIRKHPQTKQIVLPIASDFVVDDFNLQLLDVWPPWSGPPINEAGQANQEQFFSTSSMHDMAKSLEPCSICIHIQNKAKAGANEESSDFYDDLTSDEVHQGNFADFIMKNYETHRQFIPKMSTFYTLVHQRYIFTRQALLAYEQLFNNDGLGVGKCPRYQCNGQSMLPHGEHWKPGVSRLRGFCPVCQNVFKTESALDGALLGPSWAPYFLLAHWNVQARKGKYGQLLEMPYYKHLLGMEPIETGSVVPRIFGFRLADSSLLYERI